MNGRFVSFWIIAALVVAIGAGLLVGACGGGGGEDTGEKSGQKRTLTRNGPYYEIVGDGDDFGNYFETYTVPTPYGDVYCVIYTDKIGETGGGAAGNCWPVRELSADR